MPSFSFEVPLPNLKDFEEDQDFLFTLSFLFKEEAYLQHTLDMKANGYKIILDNSFNELGKADGLKQINDLYFLINPDYVICPDDNQWSAGQHLSIFKELSSNVPEDKIYIVARNKEMYLHFIDNKVKNISIPYRFRPTYYDAYLYQGFTEKEKECFKGLHFLGLNTPDEPKKYKITSCDTSMPIKLAKEGLSIKGWKALNCPHLYSKPHFFYKALSLKEVKLSKRNIKELREVNT